MKFLHFKIFAFFLTSFMTWWLFERIIILFSKYNIIIIFPANTVTVPSVNLKITIITNHTIIHHLSTAASYYTMLYILHISHIPKFPPPIQFTHRDPPTLPTILISIHPSIHPVTPPPPPPASIHLSLTTHPQSQLSTTYRHLFHAAINCNLLNGILEIIILISKVTKKRFSTSLTIYILTLL